MPHRLQLSARALYGVDDLFRANVEHLIDPASDQLGTARGSKQVYRRLVDCNDRSVPGQRDRAVVLQIHELGPCMEAKHDVALEVTQEQAFLDQPRRHVHQRHRVSEAGARVTRVERRRVEHRDQRS